MSEEKATAPRKRKPRVMVGAWPRWFRRTVLVRTPAGFKSRRDYILTFLDKARAEVDPHATPDSLVKAEAWWRNHARVIPPPPVRAKAQKRTRGPRPATPIRYAHIEQNLTTLLDAAAGLEADIHALLDTLRVLTGKE